MRPLWLFVIAFIVAALCLPPQWYPRAARVQLDAWFGADGYRAPPQSKPEEPITAEDPCPPDLVGWREAQTIEGVAISRSPGCVADNPHAVAAFVRGTNNVSLETLQKAGLTPDAVDKGADLDGDGDPDEIHIRLEVVELNGSSSELNQPTTQYAIAPGIKPGFWVFVPKTFGYEPILCQPHLHDYQSLNQNQEVFDLPNP